mmetsp:Transcript_10331/g.28522  ORF Transcript_10331/g.28522 Transcript_10331/m.28522 type:complete len:284 (-) Transcript_10331:2066-2917(-)
MKEYGSPTDQQSAGCPVDGKSSSVMSWLNLSDKQKDESGVGCSTPPSYASIEEASKHAQTPHPDQVIPLDTEREISSIPRDVAAAAKKAPHHQHDESDSHWVYPSEQQFYNAMRRKGWDNVPEDSIPLVLQIHNAVNEGTWQKIMKWEGTDQIRLVRFEGRPRDLSPLAFFYSKILRMYPAPFDRHDWYVGQSSSGAGNDENSSVPTQRYVIDYYMFDQSDPDLPPLTHIDVRPALDGPRGFLMRGQQLLKEAFPGISGYLKRMQEQQSTETRQRDNASPSGK